MIHSCRWQPRTWQSGILSGAGAHFSAASAVTMATVTMALVAAPRPAAAESISFERVVLSGEVAPGGGTGEVFATFSKPYLNDAGEVAFHATLSGPGVTTSNESGIWGPDETGAPALAAREGESAPGTSAGVVFGANPSTHAAFEEPLLAETREVIFLGALLGPGVTSANELGFWAGAAPSLPGLVARLGAPAPGVPGDSFDKFGFPPALNQSGKLVLRGELTPSNLEDIWERPAGGSLSLVAPGGGAFGSFPSEPFLNELGDLAFEGGQDRLWGPDAIGGLGIRVQFGDVAPAVPVSTFVTLFLSSLSDSGELGFFGTLPQGPGINGDNDEGIWKTSSGSPVLIAQQGSQAPGAPAGETFLLFGGPQLNAQGDSFFEARVEGPGVTFGNNEGVWGPDGAGGITLRLREGDPAVDLAAGVLLRDPKDLALGENAFLATFFLKGTGIPSGANVVGLFVSTDASDLRAVLREDDPFEVAPGDLRTIDLIEAISERSLNLDNEIVVKLLFTDGSEGIFVAKVSDEVPVAAGSGVSGSALGGSAEPGGLDFTVDNTGGGNFVAGLDVANTRRELLGKLPMPASTPFAAHASPFLLWKLEYEGTLVSPAILTFAYDETSLVTPESGLRVFRFDQGEGNWELVGGAVDTVANTVTVTADPASHFVLGQPATTPTTSCEFFGIGQGGFVDLSIGVFPVSVATSLGQTPEDVAQAITDAINNAPLLVAAGVVATPLGATVGIVGGLISRVDIQDAGLTHIPGVSVLPLFDPLFTRLFPAALLLGGMLTLVRRHRG